MDFVHNPYRCGPLRVGRYDVSSHSPSYIYSAIVTLTVSEFYSNYMMFPGGEC